MPPLRTWSASATLQQRGRTYHYTVTGTIEEMNIHTYKAGD